MRQVRRKNNLNKETLICIPYISRYCNLNVYNPNCKIARRIIDYILLLLLVIHIYLGMCPSVPTHIHSYMSKSRLLLETDDETMSYVYGGSCTCLGPRPKVFHCWCYRTGPQGVQEVGLIVCLFINVTRGRKPTLLSDT